MPVLGEEHQQGKDRDPIDRFALDGSQAALFTVHIFILLVSAEWLNVVTYRLVRIPAAGQPKPTESMTVPPVNGSIAWSELFFFGGACARG
jgi:hypothetical protein